MNLLEAKIYYDGSNWIAIPHTERPYRQRRPRDRPNKAHAIAHGAAELMEEGGGRENGVIADEDTEIPGTSLTYGDFAKFTGVTIQELVEHEGEAEVSIMDRAQEIEEKIKEAAEENKMSIEGYKKELKKAPGKNIEEKIENANGAILEQYMGSSGRGR